VATYGDDSLIAEMRLENGVCNNVYAVCSHPRLLDIR